MKVPFIQTAFRGYAQRFGGMGADPETSRDP